ncbi:CPN20 [Auxenochlorella protothecoides x Auxenochlorella symbiontica]
MLALRSAPVGVVSSRPAFAGRIRAPKARVPSLLTPHATALPVEIKTVAPLGERVVVKVVEAEQKTQGGILLPSSAQKRPTQGEVVNAGTAKALKKGDKVVYSKYAGTEIELQSEDFVILKEDDVIGLINGDDIATLRPCQDRLLVEMQEAASKTAGGLLLTESSQEKPTIGRVVAVGPGRVEEESTEATPLGVEAGATVLYSKYSGTEFEGAEGKKYIVIREVDILALVT